MLSHAGWNVSAVGSIEQGLRSISESAPHALVLDLMLPDGDGLDILAALRRQGISVRVVIVTGASNPELLARAKAFAPGAVLQKPLDFGKLISALG